MRVFEYVIFVKPADKAGQPVLVTDTPVIVIAEHEQEVLLQAARAIPEGHPLDRVEVAVRPF